LVIFGDNITRCWKQIIYHGGEREPRDGGEELPEPISETDSPGFMLEEGLHLISDERGVRLAREEEGDD
jgi:cyanophycin synthetase